MKLCKKIGVTLITIFLIIGMTGCMGISSLFQTDESIRDEILANLKEKYNGQEFVALALENGQFKTLYCYPKGGDPESDNVKARMIVKKDGTKEFSDTYFGIIIREDLETEIVSALTNLAIPIKAFFNYDSLYYENSFDGTKNYNDLKQWINDGNPRRFTITIVLLVDNEKKESYAKQIFHILEDDGFQGMIHSCTVSNVDVYQEITKTNLNEMIRKNDETISLFSESIN